MKREFKTFVLGAVMSALVVSSVPTMAEKLTKSAELLYNNIKVVIDGKQADLKDANGNRIEPFIIDGTTYLPVRGVANALDKAVSWDGATQTVYLGANEQIEQPSVWLKDLETFTGDAEAKSIDEIEFGGRDYNNILTANSGDIYKNYWYSCDSVSYLLNYKYSKFKGTFYLSKCFKDFEYSRRIVIYGDDKIIYTSDGLTSGDKAINFDIDVSNVSVLKIVPQLNDKDETGNWYMTTNYSYSTPIGNAGLYE